jgi:hypothetical protein
MWSAWRIPTAVFSIFWTKATIFLSSSPLIVLRKLSGPRSRLITSQKIWQHRELSCLTYFCPVTSFNIEGVQCHRFLKLIWLLKNSCFCNVSQCSMASTALCPGSHIRWILLHSIIVTLDCTQFHNSQYGRGQRLHAMFDNAVLMLLSIEAPSFKIFSIILKQTNKQTKNSMAWAHLTFQKRRDSPWLHNHTKILPL